MATVEIVVKSVDQATGSLRSIRGELDSISGAAGQAQSAGSGFFSNLLSTAGGVLASGAITSIASQFTSLIGSGLSFNNSMEQVTAQLNAFTKDGAKSAEILDMIRDRASKTPFEFQEMASAAAALLPASKMAGVGLEDLIKQAEVLAASNPAEGLEGAAFSLKEALSGDFTSIVERFNLPRQRLKELKDDGVPALKAVQIAMQELGLDADLVSNMAETASGRWSTFKDTITGVVSTITAPIFDAFSAGMAEVNGWLTANEPLLTSFATTLATGVAQGVAGAVQAVGLLQTAWTELQAVFQSDSLTGVVTDIAGFVQDAVPGLTNLTAAGQAFGTILDQLGSIAATAFAAITQGVGESAPAVQQGFAAYTSAVDTVIGVFGSILGTISTILSAIQAGIAAHGGEVTATFLSAWSAVQTTVAAVVSALAGVIQSVLGVIQGFVQAHGAEVAAFFAAAWAQIGGIVQTAMALIQATVVPALQGVGSFISSHGTEIQAILSAAWNTVATIVTTVLATIQGILKATLQAVQGDWKGAWTTIQTTCATIVQAILTVVQNQITLLANVFRVGIDAALGIVQGFVGQFGGAGADLVAGVVEGVRRSAGQLVSAMQGLAQDALNAAKNTLGIHSPSEEAARQIGSPLVEGIAVGISRAGNRASAVLAGVLQGTLQTARDLWSVGGDVSQAAASRLGEPFAKGVIAGIEKVAPHISLAADAFSREGFKVIPAAFEPALHGAQDTIIQATGGFTQAGSNLVQGMTEGVKAAARALASAAASAARQALDAAKDALGIHSPSEEAAAHVGDPFVQGIVAGIERSSSLIKAAARTLSKQLTSDMEKVAEEAAKAFQTVLQDGLEAAVGMDRTRLSNIRGIEDLQGDSRLVDLENQRDDLEDRETTRQAQANREAATDAQQHEQKLADLTRDRTRQQEDYDRKSGDLREKAAADEAERQRKLAEIAASTDFAENKAKKIADINETYAKKDADRAKQQGDLDFAYARQQEDAQRRLNDENSRYAADQQQAREQAQQAARDYQAKLQEIDQQIAAETVRTQRRGQIASEAQRQITDAEQQANAIRQTDAAAADKYLKERSSQILETARVQVEIAEAEAQGDDAKATSLRTQLALLHETHQAELALFANNQQQNNPYAGLQDSLTTVRDKLLAELQRDQGFYNLTDRNNTKMRGKIANEIGQDQAALDGVQSLLDTIAAQISAGVGAGMGGDTSLVDAIKVSMDMAVKAAQEALDIHSPSRVFAEKVGKPSAQGMAKGMIASMDEVKTSAAKVAQSGVNAAQDASITAGGRMGGGDTYHFTFAQRGPSLSKTDLQQMIADALAAQGRRGDIRLRTGG